MRTSTQTVPQAKPFNEYGDDRDLPAIAMSWDAARLLGSDDGLDDAIQMRGFGELIADLMGKFASVEIAVFEDAKTGIEVPAMIIEFDETISRFAVLLADGQFAPPQMIEALRLRMQYFQEKLRFFEEWGSD